MGRQGAFGSEIRIEVSSVLTAVAYAQEINFPELEKVLAEITAHDSPGGWDEQIDTGKRKSGEFTLKLTWDPDEETHAAILAAFDATGSLRTVLTPPDKAEYLGFEAFVQKVGRIVEQEEGYACEVTFKPTGLMSHGSGSGS